MNRRLQRFIEVAILTSLTSLLGLVLFTNLAVAGAPSLLLRGDVDSNGIVEMTDASVIIGWLWLGDEEPGCMDAADTNDDGKIDISDVIRLLDHLYKGAVLAEPTEEPGIDETPDALGCRSSQVAPGPSCGDSFVVEASGWDSGVGTCCRQGYWWRSIGESCSLTSSIRDHYEALADQDFREKALAAVDCPASCPATLVDSEYDVELEANGRWRRFGQFEMRCSGWVSADVEGTATVSCGR